MASGITFALGAPKYSPAKGAGLQPDKQNGTKRSHASLGDDSDDEATPAKQVVTHFDSKGAYNKAQPAVEKAPLVIQALANRDWRDSSKATQTQKRAKYGLPARSVEEESKSREEELRKLEDAKKPTFGLNVKSRVEGGNQDTPQDISWKAAQDSIEPEQAPRRQRTDDERALDALMGIKEKSDLTIPAASEEDAFQRDYRDAPDMPSLEQYAATPVEEFGAALLRGMGWKEGHGIGNQSGQKIQKVKMLERRPALLGIGAKEDAAVKEEMGAWGKGAGRGKVPQVYNPVVMRNRKTGEEITEDEMSKRVEQQKSKEREAELDALHDVSRKGSDRDRKSMDNRRRRDEESDEEYERKRREKRRERERYRDRDGYDDRARKRSKDRGHGRDGDRQDSRRDDDRRRRDRDRDLHHNEDRHRRRDRDDRDDRSDRRDNHRRRHD